MEGNGYIIKDESLAMIGKVEFIKPKSYSIIAMNLETVDDVDKVIRQCESIKKELTGGSRKLSIVENGTIVAT